MLSMHMAVRPCLAVWLNLGISQVDSLGNTTLDTVAALIHGDSIVKLMPPSISLGIRSFKQITFPIFETAF